MHWLKRSTQSFPDSHLSSYSHHSIILQCVWIFSWHTFFIKEAVLLWVVWLSSRSPVEKCNFTSRTYFYNRPLRKTLQNSLDRFYLVIGWRVIMVEKAAQIRDVMCCEFKDCRLVGLFCHPRNKRPQPITRHLDSLSATETKNWII